MMALFALGGLEFTRAEVSAMLRKEEDPSFMGCAYLILAIFLNGLITDRGGKRVGPQPPPEKSLSNNKVFMKLKVALGLNADDTLEMMKLVDFEISKHELSAFFHEVMHKSYRKCKGQALRNFFNGMQMKYRSSDISSDKPEKESKPAPKNLSIEKLRSLGEEADCSKDNKQQEGIWPTNFKG